MWNNLPLHLRDFELSGVSPVTENAFVWLKIAAPSDLLLDVVRLTNVLTYLLTYLLMYVKLLQHVTHNTTVTDILVIEVPTDN